ncbi:RNA 2',3'-cyclic phosphodiesterase [soil metagenome]
MTGDGRLRLFVAVDVPRASLEAVERAVEPLRAALPGGRWTAGDGLHVTLKFLGATPSDRLEVVSRAVEVVAGARAPARVSLGGVGGFPNRRRARVLWVGLDDPAGLLASLAADLERALEPLGYLSEKRSYTPHLTLARFSTPASLPRGILERVDGDPFRVESVTLWRSRPSPQGARYEALRSFTLEGPRAPSGVER